MSANPGPATGRFKLIMLASLFAAPIVLSGLLYTVGWRPAGTVHHGDLADPPQPVADVVLSAVGGEPLRIARTGRWLLVYFAGETCDGACMQALHTMRQAHLAQGRQGDRVRRVMILTGKQEPAWIGRVRQDYPDMQILAGTKEGIEALAGSFSLPRRGRADTAGRIHVVDPRAYFMMSYPADADPSDMRKDLARLLKVSQIG